MGHVRLYPRQTNDRASLFRVENSHTGKFSLREDVAKDSCISCGKFDEMKSLRSGHYNRCAIKSDQDFIATWDLLPIVSARLKDFWESVAKDSIEFFDFSDGAFFVALPRNVIVPDPTRDGFRALNKCRSCNRYSELLWGSPDGRLPVDCDICVFLLENRMGITPVWTVCKEVAMAITKASPKFKGFVKDPF